MLSKKNIQKKLQKIKEELWPIYTALEKRRIRNLWCFLLASLIYIIGVFVILSLALSNAASDEDHGKRMNLFSH